MENRFPTYNSKAEYDAAKDSLPIPYVATYPSGTDGKTVVVYANVDGTNESEVVATAELTKLINQLSGELDGFESETTTKLTELEAAINDNDDRIASLHKETNTKLNELELKLGDVNLQINGSEDVIIDPTSTHILNCYVNKNNTWSVNNNNSVGCLVDVREYRKRTLKIKAGSTEGSLYTFVTDYPVNGSPVVYSTGYSRVSINSDVEIDVIIPQDAVYFWFADHSYAHTFTPQNIEIAKITGIADSSLIINSLLIAGNFPKKIWERGSITNSGKMTPSNEDLDYKRTIRTKNYIKCHSFTYTARKGEILYVYEYGDNFSFIAKKEIYSSYLMPIGVSYIKLALVLETENNIVNIPLEQGSISSTDGSEISSSKNVRTDFLNLDNPIFDEIWYLGESVLGYYYDSSYSYVKNNGAVIRFAQWFGGYASLKSIKSVIKEQLVDGVKYVRLIFAGKDNGNTTPETFVYKFTNGEITTLLPPNISCDSFQEIKNYNIGGIDNGKVNAYLFDVHHCGGFSVTIDESADIPPMKIYDNGRYFAALKLALPANYSPIGEPTKLIIWCQGSGDYPGMGDRALSNNESYINNMGYWLKSGYAIASMNVTTSKYGSMNGDINGMPTNIAAYETGYKWLMEHFNLDNNGCYISAKSMGGVGALALCYSNIPIKAADFFAPALDPFYQQLGYGIYSRMCFIEDLNLDNCEPLITNTSPASPMTKEDFRALMIGNKFKMQGHNAYFAGVTNKTFEQLVALDVKNPGKYDDVIKYCRVPLRIHIAADDTTVGYYQSLNLVTAIKNANCVAEIRTLPAGCSNPHHATDSDPDALRVDSITTSLGDVCTDIAIAYVEALDWFEAHA